MIQPLILQWVVRHMTFSSLFIYQGEKDDKIIAVCADDPEYRHYTDIRELPPHRLAEIRRFFEDCMPFFLLIVFSGFKGSFYEQWERIIDFFFLSLTNNSDKKNENKEVAVNDFLPSKAAHDAVQHSM